MQPHDLCHSWLIACDAGSALSNQLLDELYNLRTARRASPNLALQRIFQFSQDYLTVKVTAVVCVIDPDAEIVIV